MKQIVVLLLGIVALVFPTPVLAGPDWSVSSEDPATLEDVEVIVARLVIILSGLIGFAFVVMLVVGGYKYLTAGDNPKNAEAAKKTLTLAAVGLVLFFSALMIITLLERLFGINLGSFNIEPPQIAAP